MPRVALATSADYPRLSPDDAHLLAAVQERGLGWEPLVWDDPRAGWASLDGVVLRTVWDYTSKAAAFLAWTRRLEGLGVPLWNPPALLRWNHDKRYLLDLAERGVAVVASRAVPPGEPLDLARLLDEEGWEHAVVKPLVSAGGIGTARVDRKAPQLDPEAARLARERGALVQPFVPEVVAEGEWSLVFFDGRFSHAALKRPPRGDFRVNARAGGTVQAAEPPRALVEEAAAALRAAPGEAAYARVDGVRVGGRLLLMELELIEPELFFRLDAGAAGRYLDALGRRLGA